MSMIQHLSLTWTVHTKDGLKSLRLSGFLYKSPTGACISSLHKPIPTLNQSDSSNHTPQYVLSDPILSSLQCLTECSQQCRPTKLIPPSAATATATCRFLPASRAHRFQCCVYEPNNYVFVSSGPGRPCFRCGHGECEWCVQYRRITGGVMGDEMAGEKAEEEEGEVDKEMEKK
jgi:hypothetical protein